MDSNKDQLRQKFQQTGRGRRQDHATRGNNHRDREWDDREDKVLIAERRDERRGKNDMEAES